MKKVYNNTSELGPFGPPGSIPGGGVIFIVST